MPEDAYNACVDRWAVKEMQLTQLHEEIVARRELLLQPTGTSLHQRQQAGKERNGVSTGDQTLDDITIRNERLLKDIKDVDTTLGEESARPPDIKFHTLQSNYWAMVRNMQPLWEEALQEAGTDNGEGMRRTRSAPLEGSYFSDKLTTLLYDL